MSCASYQAVMAAAEGGAPSLAVPVARQRPAARFLPRKRSDMTVSSTGRPPIERRDPAARPSDPVALACVPGCREFVEDLAGGVGGDLPPRNDLADRRQERAGRVDACGVILPLRPGTGGRSGAGAQNAAAGLAACRTFGPSTGTSRASSSSSFCPRRSEFDEVADPSRADEASTWSR